LNTTTTRSLEMFHSISLQLLHSHPTYYIVWEMVTNMMLFKTKQFIRHQYTKEWHDCRHKSVIGTCESAVCVRIESRIESKEMCGTAVSSFQSSNTLNNTGVWSLIELASLYTVPLSAVNGLSRLTTTSNGQARPIQIFSNRNGQFESRSFAGP